jgi:hypothetical protein
MPVYSFRRKYIYRQKALVMKKKASDLLGVICVAAVFAGCVEGLDGSLTWWTVVCLAVAGITGYFSKRLEDAK